MNEFGIAFKEERKRAKKKLREVAEHLKLSTSYISDIEQGRKAPPDLGVVQNLQRFLSVSDDKLVKLAEKVRTTRPGEVAQRIQERPQLSELFYRVQGMTDEQLEQLINSTSNK